MNKSTRRIKWDLMGRVARISAALLFSFSSCNLPLQALAMSEFVETGVKAPAMVPEDSVSCYLPSESAPGRGLAVNIIFPAKPRYADGAPVVVVAPGGAGPDGLSFEMHAAQMGFVEVRFAFPGGGKGKFNSSGIYDYRGVESQKALRDVILFAAGRMLDKDGRKISDLVPIKVSQDNVGLVGWSNGGNVALVTMAKFASELQFLSWVAFYESPLGSMFFPPNLGGENDVVLNKHYRQGSGATGDCLIDYKKLKYDPYVLRRPGEHKKRGEAEIPGVIFFDDNGNLQWDEPAEFCFSYASDIGLDKQIYPPDVTAAMERMGVFVRQLTITRRKDIEYDEDHPKLKDREYFSDILKGTPVDVYLKGQLISGPGLAKRDKQDSNKQKIVIKDPNDPNRNLPDPRAVVEDDMASGSSQQSGDKSAKIGSESPTEESDAERRNKMLARTPSTVSAGQDYNISSSGRAEEIEKKYDIPVSWGEAPPNTLLASRKQHYSFRLDTRPEAVTPRIDLGEPKAVDAGYKGFFFPTDPKKAVRKPPKLTVSMVCWPDDIATLKESEGFYEERDGSLYIPQVAELYPNLLVMVCATEVDHLQSQPDHPHIALQYNAWLSSKVRWLRLNADPSYVAQASGLNKGNFKNNPPKSPIDASEIATFLEPEGMTPDYAYVEACISELADRKRMKYLRGAMNDVLCPYDSGAFPPPKKKNEK